MPRPLLVNVTVVAVVIYGCGLLDDGSRTSWELRSARIPGLTVACRGQQPLTSDECLRLGEHAAGAAAGGFRARRVEVEIGPGAQECDFTLVDAEGRPFEIMSRGPCAPSS